MPMTFRTIALEAEHAPPLHSIPKLTTLQLCFLELYAIKDVQWVIIRYGLVERQSELPTVYCHI